MFDTVKCLYALPLPEGVENTGFIQKNIEFQTKDLENLLTTYLIKENGELYRIEEKYKWIDDDNHFLKGYAEVESSTEVKENFHGMLNFYSYDDLMQDNGKILNVSIDYIAKFTDGILVDVKIEKYKITDVTEQKENSKKFMENALKEDAIWYNKYVFRSKLYMIFKKTVFKCFNIWLDLNKSAYYFLIRHL